MNNKISNNFKYGGLAYIAALSLMIFLGLVFNTLFTQYGVSEKIIEVFGFLYSAIAMLIVLLSVKCFKSGEFKGILKVKKFHPIFLVSAILLALGMILGLGFVNVWFSNVLNNAGYSVVSSIKINMENIEDYLLYVVIVCIIPAFIEELFFRGAILSSFSFGGFFAVILCGLSFALFHCSAVQFVYQFIYGCLLALLVEKSGSVIPAFIAHFLNNLFVLTLEYLGYNIALTSPVVIAVGAVLLFLFFVITLSTKHKVKIVREKAYAVDGALNMFLLFGGFCLAVFIIFSNLVKL